jgi:hypothetical protein
MQSISDLYQMYTLAANSYPLYVHIMQTYISSSDKAFTAATIEAIGRVACSISEVTETCLHGLMSLLSHKDGKGSSQYIVLHVHVHVHVSLVCFVQRLLLVRVWWS